MIKPILGNITHWPEAIAWSAQHIFPSVKGKGCCVEPQKKYLIWHLLQPLPQNRPSPRQTYVLSEVSAPVQGPEFKGSVKHLKKGIPLRTEAFFFHEMRQGKRAAVLQD